MVVEFAYIPGGDCDMRPANRRVGDYIAELGRQSVVVGPGIVGLPTVTFPMTKAAAD